ncbi:MAG: hypothetical protein EZS28_019141 [Streblomastix strix]|uniref:Uncharacterized protein n=1 Tax=Streblomastix strix TaxID=222440 RepID=A0A5J4VRV2_9EUKA|nr:MAG: hypothetical protein EZS28_019141 [Streblomastix strix]
MLEYRRKISQSRTLGLQHKNGKNEILGKANVPAYGMNRMHIVQENTKSLTWAISRDSNRGPEQSFDAVIIEQQFYDKYKDSIFCANGQKQIFHIGFEKQGYNCIALNPKNYIINDEIVLKGVILIQNPQKNEQAFVNNINKGTVTDAVNITLAQNRGQVLIDILLNND